MCVTNICAVSGFKSSEIMSVLSLAAVFEKAALIDLHALEEDSHEPPDLDFET